MKKLFFIILIIISLVSCIKSQYLKEIITITLPRIAPIKLEPYSKISFAPIEEASGLVQSRQFANVFWVHNDSGDKPRIFAIAKEGNIIKPQSLKEYSGIHIIDAKNIDWEDIATDDKGNLIIGDCGNNKNNRTDLTIYIIKEPSPFKTEITPIITSIPFYYPDQVSNSPTKKNFDAEAIFWANDKIYLLTKHRSDEFTKLYRFDSMNPLTKNPLTLIGSFEIRGQVTAADISPNRNMLAVLTNNAIWLFEALDAQDNYFDGKISWLPIEAKQCEAICFDGNDLIIANEQRDLFKLPLDSLVVVQEK